MSPIRIHCPHCGGKLTRSIFIDCDYDCGQCGRGWKIEGDIWLSHFDTMQIRYLRRNGRFKGLSTIKR
jgi:DNA-directed RNA polymerase subunit RPC12/RpoP